MNKLLNLNIKLSSYLKFSNNLTYFTTYKSNYTQAKSYNYKYNNRISIQYKEKYLQAPKYPLEALRPFENKTECLAELKTHSQVLSQTLTKHSWLKNPTKAAWPLKNYTDNIELEEVKNIIMFKSPRFNYMIYYFGKNLHEFSCKEKAIAFRILATLNQLCQKKDKKRRDLQDLLCQFERDYYYNIDKCDLIDFANYTDAFFLFRKSNVHFISESFEPMYRKAKGCLERTANESR
jgi:hypothetical protein